MSFCDDVADALEGCGYCWVAVESCGCVTAVISDLRDTRALAEQTRREVALLERSGRKVRRVPTAEVATLRLGCSCATRNPTLVGFGRPPGHAAREVGS